MHTKNRPSRYDLAARCGTIAQHITAFGRTCFVGHMVSHRSRRHCVSNDKTSWRGDWKSVVYCVRSLGRRSRRRPSNARRYIFMQRVDSYNWGYVEALYLHSVERRSESDNGFVCAEPLQVLPTEEAFPRRVFRPRKLYSRFKK